MLQIYSYNSPNTSLLLFLRAGAQSATQLDQNIIKSPWPTSAKPSHNRQEAWPALLTGIITLPQQQHSAYPKEGHF